MWMISCTIMGIKAVVAMGYYQDHNGSGRRTMAPETKNKSIRMP